MILEPTAHHIQRAADAIKRGELVAFPTETVYGLGANLFDAAAVAAIYRLKGRPATNPLIAHIATVDSLHQLTGDLSAQQSEWIHHLTPLWPGPLSLVLPCNSAVPAIVSAGHPTIAVRMPAHPVALELIRRAGVPIAAPSANRSNYISPTTAAHVHAEFGQALPYILDGGACQVGIESTVLSLLGPTPKILRLGSIAQRQLEERIGSVEGPGSPTTPLPTVSPGMSIKHYSPRTTLRYIDAASAAVSQRIGVIRFDARPLPAPLAPTKVCTLSEAGNAEEIAARLYAALRELDELGLDLILIDRCARTGLGAAIMDRLDRAMAS